MATATKTAAPAALKNGNNGHDASNRDVHPVNVKPANSGVHPQLATPTDLKPEETQIVADTVNPLVADHIALWLKYKNYHWHLASSHFRDYHLLFDEHADDVFDAIDVLAERVRKVGRTTVRSISHVAQLTSVEDDNSEFVPPAQMVQNLLKENLASAAKLRDAIEKTEDARDTPTSNILQDILDHTERRIWFLYDTSTGAEFEN